eukprot:6510674-Alexandrium_andersonii.AAC.1
MRHAKVFGRPNGLALLSTVAAGQAQALSSTRWQCESATIKTPAARCCQSFRRFRWPAASLPSA